MTNKTTPLHRDEEAELVAIRKARNWISRWKMIGGGFTVDQTLEGSSVAMVRNLEPDAKIEARVSRIASGLETELAANETTRKIVVAMVLAARQAAQMREPANDQEEPQPAA